MGKLKNLRVTQEDLDAQKKNLEILAGVERLLELVMELGGTASYLSQAEMVLPSEHSWVKQAETVRKSLQEKLSQDRMAVHASEYQQTLNQLKKNYITAYIASHSKARLGVAEDKTRNGLRKDERLLSLRVLAGVSLMPTSQLTAFEEALNGLKSCSSLDEPTLLTSAICPHCQFRPSAEQLELIPKWIDRADDPPLAPPTPTAYPVEAVRPRVSNATTEHEPATRETAPNLMNTEISMEKTNAVE